MAEEIPPAHGLALGHFYRKRGLTPTQAAGRLGLADTGTLRKLEKGIVKMSRETLDEKAGRLGFTPEDVDAFLFGDGLIEPEPPPQPASPVALTREELRRIDRAVVAAAWATAEDLRARLIRWKKARKAAAAHREAEALWASLKPLPLADRRDLVRVFPHYRSWALVVKVCRESVRVAAHDAAEALELAEFALFIAERCPGEESWRARIQAEAWGFLGNTRRVANDFDGADAAFARSKQLLEAAAGADPDLLDPTRLLDLEATFRGEQHRFSEGLELLDQAKEASRGGATTGRLLLQKEHVLSRMGDYEGALAVLDEAKPLIEKADDPGLLFALRFNSADNLALLQRYAEAEVLLPKVRELALDQGHSLQLIRVLWLSAKVDAGQGRKDRAMAALEQVQRDFTVRRLPYDAAQSSLDLSLLWLEQRRTTEVRELALGMAWIFKAKGIHEKALAALRIFCEAAREEEATVELTRQVIADVEKIRRTAPSLRRSV
jgi:tetratricopeptide (TPR) repeat protein